MSHEPWWPIKWRQVDTLGIHEEHFLAVFDLPNGMRIRIHRGGSPDPQDYYRVYSNTFYNNTTILHTDNLATVRCALLNLAYPEGNNDR